MMIQQDDNITRTEVDNNPGWVKVRNKRNNSYQYVSPDGRLVSAREYKELFGQYGSNIPATAIKGMTTDTGFLGSHEVARNPIEHPEHRTPPPSTQATVADSIAYQQQQSQAQQEQTAWENVVDIAAAIPDPKKPSGRATVSRPSDHDVAMGMANILITATVLIAMLSNIPEVRMNEQQAVDIVVPFFNIAKKHGWLNAGASRVIAEGDDWAQLGKGLVLYLSVVVPAIQARINLMNAEAQYRRSQAEQMRQGGAARPQSPFQDIPRQHMAGAAPSEVPVPSQNGNGNGNHAFMPQANNIKLPPGVVPPESMIG